MKNNASDNTNGIIVYSSMNSTISDNILNGNGCGLNITDGSMYNAFSRNRAENNTYGISVASSSAHNRGTSNTACFNLKYDFYHTASDNAGTDNTCSKARGWSDENLTGCTDRCTYPVIRECKEAYGGPYDETGKKVIETSDGGYAIIGTTSSYGAGGDDVWLVKADENCAIEWNRTYGGTKDDSGSSIRQTSDYGYVIVGTTESYGAGGDDMWLLKVSEGGTAEWDKTLGYAYTDRGSDVLELPDGYLLLGTTEVDSQIGAGNYNLWMLKTDRSGNKIWEKNMGGDLTEYGYSLSRTLEGGYVVGGATRSTGAGGFDAWRLKFSPDLVSEKENQYGSTGNDYAYSCFQTPDGGYTIGGSTSSYGSGGYDALLIKTNHLGATAWNKKYGGTGDDYAYSMIRAYDGGYILAGSTKSFATGGPDYWIVKTDSLGNMKGQLPIGGTGNETAYSVIETYDGAYLMVGCTDSYGSGGNDLWLVRTRSPEVTTSTSTSSTTTTSATTTTTTLGSPCDNPGNYPPCDEVTLAEIVSYINAWSRGEAELGDVIDLIIDWSYQN